jgi:hypothetical protein
VTNRRRNAEFCRRLFELSVALVHAGGTYELARRGLDNAFTRGILGENRYHTFLLQLRDEWLWINRRQVEHRPLEQFAQDSQNVHTKHVTEQTIHAQKELISIVASGNVLEEIEREWKGKYKYGKVLNDMKYWYSVSLCITKDDWLYKRMLDGLWTKIKEHKEKEELVKRLWEESLDSVGMCCQGHLGRLSNVMIGFGEDSVQQQSFGEILQNKMSEIARLENTTEYKVKQALLFFEQHNVPETERTAWLEAF